MLGDIRGYVAVSETIYKGGENEQTDQSRSFSSSIIEVPMTGEIEGEAAAAFKYKEL